MIALQWILILICAVTCIASLILSPFFWLLVALTALINLYEEHKRNA